MSRQTAGTWARRVAVATAALVAALGIGLVLLVTVAGKFGDVALGMKTGSMRPVINPGDLVIVRQVDPRLLHAGELVTFRRPSEPDEIYTHRIVSVSSSSGNVEIHTRGDANPVADPWTVSYTGPAWRVVHVVRDGGYVLMVVQSHMARDAIAASIFVLSLYLLWPIIVSPPSRLAGSRQSLAGA